MHKYMGRQPSLGRINTAEIIERLQKIRSNDDVLSCPDALTDPVIAEYKQIDKDVRQSLSRLSKISSGWISKWNLKLKPI